MTPMMLAVLVLIVALALLVHVVFGRLQPSIAAGIVNGFVCVALGFVVVMIVQALSCS